MIAVTPTDHGGTQMGRQPSLARLTWPLDADYVIIPRNGTSTERPGGALES